MSYEGLKTIRLLSARTLYDSVFNTCESWNANLAIDILNEGTHRESLNTWTLSKISSVNSTVFLTTGTLTKRFFLL